MAKDFGCSYAGEATNISVDGVDDRGVPLDGDRLCMNVRNADFVRV